MIKWRKLCQSILSFAFAGSCIYLGRSAFLQTRLVGETIKLQSTGAILEHIENRCDKHLLHTSLASESYYSVTSRQGLINATRHTVKDKSLKNYPIVITQFPMMNNRSIDSSRFESATPAKVEARKLDFMEAVNKSLNHPRVFAVFVLYNNPAMPTLLRDWFGKHSKLCVDKINNSYHFADVLDYVHNSFQDRLVIVTNGDIYPGEGLDKLNYDVIKRQRLFYAPARHERREGRCKMHFDSCRRYTGAHDTYIFVPEGQISEAGINLLSFPWDDLGMETVVLKVYRDFLQYRLLNPCKVLFFYHLHCSRLRHRDRKWRINYTRDVILVAPSEKLT